MKLEDYGCYTPTGIALNINKSKIFAQKCCFQKYELEVSSISKLEDFEKLNNELLLNLSSQMPCNTFGVCPKKEIDSITVNALGCNLQCYMCTCSVPPDIETKQTYFRVLNEVKNLKLEKLTLSTGGEPFIWKKETLSFLKSLNENIKIVEITTNGTLLNEEDIKSLLDCKSDVRVTVSLSGIDEKTYFNIHKNKHFYKVLNNIDTLQKIGVLKAINIVICKYNVSQLEEITQFWQSKNINITFLPIRDSTENIESTDEFKSFIKRWPRFSWITPTDLPTSLIC